MLPTILLLSLAVLAAGCASLPDAGSATLAAGSNRAFVHTVETKAPPGALWAVWTDVGGWPAWDAELTEATLDSPFAENAAGRLVPRRGPAAWFVLADVDPGRAYTLVTRLPLGALRVRRTWAPAGAGRIAVTHAVSFHGLGGRLLARRLGPAYRRALPVAMDALVARAETRASGR